VKSRPLDLRLVDDAGDDWLYTIEIPSCRRLVADGWSPVHPVCNSAETLSSSSSSTLMTYDKRTSEKIVKTDTEEINQSKK